MDIKSITDFGELPVFQRAATFPMIIVAHKKSEETSQCKQSKTTFTQVSSLSLPYPDVKQIILNNGFALPEEAFQGEQWTLANKNTLTVIQKMERSSVPLKEYLNVSIFYGIKTGCNEAYVISSSERDKLIKEDPKSEEIIKPLAVGDDIRKWHIRDNQRWIILAKIGIDITQYPVVFKHLRQYKERLEVRCDRGSEWWQLRPCQYYDLFELPKIIYPDIAKEQRFAYDPGNYYTLNTSYFIPFENYYLLGVLNSTALWTYCKERLLVLGNAHKGGRLRLFTEFIERLPIPDANDKERKIIESLVRKCARGSESKRKEIENEIDKIVSRLYGLVL